MINEINTKNFYKTISHSEKLVIVELFTENSTGSYLVELSLNDILEKNINLVEAYKINIDKHPEITQSFQLFTFPTILFYKNNELLDVITGPTPKNIIVNKINRLLNQKEYITF
ncbi:MAG: thioredoxin family protein [Ignavibacteriae bacterium]|nr:thioredoxin family protein [Ignavibacteriota bacterium]MCB9208324.1 thioredoxin family protein [Ignavibacteriales bacterium]MCB9259086.1 thioredoxin family protein [Ignavibacteriales bacterium]